MDSEIKIDMDSLVALGKDLAEVKESLKYYSDKHVLLSFCGTEIEPGFLLMILEHVISLQKDKLRRSQQQGINLALQKKYEGNGTYGRPKIILPDGFNERVKDCFENKYPLSNYCDEIEMKKSTFYKYAKKIQKGMKIEAKVDK